MEKLGVSSRPVVADEAESTFSPLDALKGKRLFSAYEMMRLLQFCVAIQNVNLLIIYQIFT
jgi:hypothetical protein